jgi:hypothetical protein
MIRGGLRSRLVIDSVRFAIISTMQQHGWFDATVHDTPPGLRRHLPFRYIPRPVDWAEDIHPNAIAISSDDITDDDLAFGGEVEDIHRIYVDIFVQDDAVGWQVAYDIRDSLLGKNPELGGLGPQVDVYDFRQPTPAPFTTIDVDVIRVDRSQGDTRAWQRHWYMIYLTFEDDYNDEADLPSTQPLARTWAEPDVTAWHRIQEVERP